ncbi:uncharacterized protein LTHEOB_12998 [Lasiodiplodia theobromae]|uniref:uncharacterized protein n=1 Tax=Lasiodiplodia theobromae TaxID=45133 RepID=UPI0015C2C86B|nr:uncharacterized protein LTHEOB_12998 [Lasiodiplodia theobromae]KAF4534192.1 hypothetical protein LTHEOB_12998 [Lasiodiplodia theobromae]
MARLRSAPKHPTLSIMASASGRKTRARTSAARGRGQNAATEDEEGKGVNIEKVASEKRHTTVDGGNGGNDENSDGWGEFKGLGKKLAESKWRLSTAQFKQVFSADMLNSRPFMRQIVAWAEYGEYTLEQALEAVTETRHRMDQCRTNRRSRIPRKHQWTAQHLTKTIERLHAQGKEQKSKRQPQRTRLLRSPSIEVARTADDHSRFERSPSSVMAESLPLLDADESTFAFPGLGTGDENSSLVGQSPPPSATGGANLASTSRSKDVHISSAQPMLEGQDGCASRDATNAPFTSTKTDKASVIDLTSPPDDTAASHITSSTSSRRNVSPAEDPTAAVPSSDVLGAIQSLQPGQWLSASAINWSLVVLSPSNVRVLDNTVIELSDPAKIHCKKPLRFQENHRYVVLPLHRNQNHWVVVSLDLDAGEADWSYTGGSCGVQKNSYDCGLHVVVTAIHHVAGLSQPENIDSVFWRGLLQHLLLPLADDDVSHPDAIDISQTTPSSESCIVGSHEACNQACSEEDIQAYEGKLKTAVNAVKKELQKLQRGSDFTAVRQVLRSAQDAANAAKQELDVALEPLQRLLDKQQEIASLYDEHVRCQAQECMTLQWLSGKSNGVKDDVTATKAKIEGLAGRLLSAESRCRALRSGVEFQDGVERARTERVGELKGRGICLRDDMRNLWKERARRRQLDEEEMEKELEVFGA